MLLVWANISAAAEVQREPARFANADEVAASIKFPETAKAGEVVIVRCGTQASRNGATDPVVYAAATNADALAPYEEQARKFLHRLRVAPARVNDRAVDVWLSFAVIFDDRNGAKQVRLVPNLQYDAQRYGEEYFDPQRVTREKTPRV